MKTKNQTEQTLLELATTNAANEESFIAPAARESAPTRKQAWSPMEVWRTRVKTELTRKETAPISPL
jgi:hypothetical protein